MASWFVVFDANTLDGLKPVKQGVYQTKIDLVFYDELQAVRHQEKLAAEKPGHLIVKLQSVTAIEAGIAPLLYKKFTPDGEVIPV